MQIKRLEKIRLWAQAGLLLAFGLGWGYCASLTSFWGDEEFTARAMLATWRGMFHQLSSDMHPPLYYICLRLWRPLWAWAGMELSLRWFSTFCAALALVVWQKVFVRLGASRPLAFAAVFFLALSPFFGWYATEAKMYAFYALVAGLAWLAWLRLMEAPQAWGRRALAGLLTAFLPYTHITGMVGMATFALWLGLGCLSREVSKDQLKAGLWAYALAILFFLPQWGTAHAQVSNTHQFWASVPDWNLFREFVNYAEFYFAGPFLLPELLQSWFYSVWMALCLAALVWGLLKLAWPLKRLLLASWLGFFFLYWLGSRLHGTAFLIPRVTLPWLPAGFLRLAAGLQAWGGWRGLALGLLLAIAWVFPAAASQHLGPAREDMRGAVAYVQRFIKPGDSLVRAGYLETYYTDQAGLKFDETPNSGQRFWLIRRRGQASEAPWQAPETQPKDFEILSARPFPSVVADFWNLDVLLVRKKQKSNQQPV